MASDSASEDERPGRVLFLDRFLRVAVLALLVLLISGPLLRMGGLAFRWIALGSLPLVIIMGMFWAQVIDLHRRLNNADGLNWLLLLLFNLPYALIYYRLRLRPRLMELFRQEQANTASPESA